MNYRTTFILGGIFLALLLLLAVAITIGPENADQGRALFPELLKTTGVDVNPGENILSLRLERARPEKQTLVLKRAESGGRWRFEQPFQGAADNFAVNNLVRAVLESRREQDRDASGSLAETGLDRPSTNVTLTDKDGKEHTLSVGKLIPGAAGNLAFVRSSGRGNTVQVVMEKDLESLFRPVGALRERTLLGAEADLEQFRLSTGPNSAKPPVALRKTQGVWRYESPAYGSAEPASLPGAAGSQPGGADVGTILRAIGGLRVEQAGEREGDRNDFIADGVTDLGAQGLDGAKNRVLRVEVERIQNPGSSAAGTKATLLVGLDKPVEKPAPKADAKGLPFKGYPATVEGSGTVVLVPAGPVADLLRLLEDPALIRDKALLRLTGGEPDWIEITNGAGRLDLVKADPVGGYRLYRPGVAEGQMVDASAVAGLLEAMKNGRGRFVADSPEKRKELDLDRPEDKRVAVRFWLAGLEKDAAKDAKKEDKKEGVPGKPVRKNQPANAEVILGKRQGDEVAILRVAGQDQAVLFAPRNLLELAEQNPLAYLDRKIPSFAGEGLTPDAALDQVVSVSVAKGAETRTVSRKDKADPWKFTVPADRAGLPVDPQAIRSLLVNLATMQARKLVAEKPAPAELASRGLQPPAVTVTLVLQGADGKPQTKSFALGKESEDGGVYALPGWSDRVVTVDLSLRSIVEAPWENRQLFASLDPAKVTRLKFTGWQSGNGSPVNLVLEREKDQWISRDPASDFPVAQAKVGQILAGLKTLRFERVLAYTGGGDPALGLDPSRNGLAIEWTVEGQKDPVRLVVGRAEGSGLAASVSTLPGMALVVPKAPFEDALQGRGKFRQ